MLVRQARAAAYHSRALEATALAQTSILDRVREKHEVAAARWRVLAALNERAEPVATPQSRAAGQVRTGGPVHNREETPCIT